MPEPQVSNIDFLKAVFSAAAPDEWLWVCGIPGDPQGKGARWTGKAIKLGQAPALKGADNTYFNVSTLKPAPDGKVSRAKECFSGLFCVVLDDVGTKADMPALGASWVLETSPGNHQVGYILAETCRDLAKAQAVVSALGRSGLSDPGAGGPSSRYVRLPVGRNGKPSCGAGWNHRLREWAPERRYFLDELVTGLGLDLEAPATTTTAPRPVATKEATPSTVPKTRPMSDEAVIARVLRSPKAARVWEGNDAGFGSGSDADQWLCNMLAYGTSGPEQIERIYSRSARADRVSSDGTRKWRDRKDYRDRTLKAAITFVEAHPNGDADEAEAVVLAALAKATSEGNARGLVEGEVLEAWNVLKIENRAAFDDFRAQARKAGMKLSTLDAELDMHRGVANLLDVDAAELAAVELGGLDGLTFTQGSWFVWSGVVWERLDSDEPIKRAIHAVMPRKQITAAKVGSVLSLLRTLVASDEPMDAHRPGITAVCASGELVWRDAEAGQPWGRWELQPHTREARRTHVLPVAWDDAAECPTFCNFLNSLTVKDCPAEAIAKQRALCEAIGYSLTSWTGLERFVLLYGPLASNGKSTLLNLLKSLTGKASASLSVSQLSQRFAVAKLQGALVNLCSEIARGEVLPEAQVKAIVSGDAVTAERKGKDLFELVPVSTLWFATNTLPSTRDLSPALLDKRCLLLELTRSFEGDTAKDTALGAKLGRELPGILRMCLEAFGRALSLSRMPVAWTVDVGTGMRQTLEHCDVRPMEDTPAGLLAKAAWRQESDPVRLFVTERLVVAHGHQVGPSELFEAWKAWAESEGLRLELSSSGLVRRLKAMHPGQIDAGDHLRIARKRMVQGCCLAPID